MPQPVRTRYTEDSDKLILEDELQRIFLVGKLDVKTTVTGEGDFYVFLVRLRFVERDVALL